MKNTNKFTLFIALLLFVISANAQTNSFTYQGKLNAGGAAANGSYEMRFTLYDQAADGFEIGTPKTIPNVAVVNGIFTVQLLLGDWIFDQNDRFIKIEIRPQGNMNPFTVLAPLQPVTLAPKAAFSNAAAFANFSESSGNAINLAGLGVGQFVQKNAGGEIVAPRLENLAADPAPASAANAGRIYFNTTTNSLMVSNGTAWTSASSRIQTFTGELAGGSFNCTQTTTAIRTATFTKSSAASRLRITIRDVASATGSGSFYLTVNTRIDGVFVSNPTNFRIVTRSRYDDQLTFGRNSTVKNTFTTVGYANGVAAGTHTFTTTYSFQIEDVGGAYTCNRDPDAYLIEIEEVP